MELNWFSPQEAKDFVKLAIKQKLLKEKDGLVIPTFNVDHVMIPVGFSPTKQVFEIKQSDDKKEELDLMTTIVERINNKTNLGKDAIFEEIKKIEQEKNVTSEVATLLVGKEHDVVLEEFYKKIKEKILR